MGSPSEDARAEALRDVICLRRPLSESLPALSKFTWDSEEELVAVTPSDVTHLLVALLDGRLTAHDVELWAESLYGRDDVKLQERGEELLKQFLFEASTPELFESLDQSATDWLERFRDV